MKSSKKPYKPKSKANRKEKYVSNLAANEAEDSKKELIPVMKEGAFPYSNAAQPTGRTIKKINSNASNNTAESKRRRVSLPPKAIKELEEEGVDIEKIKESAQSFLELSLVQKEGKTSELGEDEKKRLEEKAKELPSNVKTVLDRHLDDAHTMAHQLDDEALMNVKLDLGDEDNQVEVQEVVVQQVKLPFYIIKSDSDWRLRWDLFVILLVLYNCISIPLEIGFPTSAEGLGPQVVSNIIDLCFAIDMICNFVTTYINEKTGLEVIECKQISKHYVHQWRFWIDLAATIPFEHIYVIFSGGDTDFNFSIFDLLKLIRLLRLGRIISYMKVKQDVKAGFRIVQLLGFLLLLVHWVGCIWYILVRNSHWIPPKDLDSGETNFYEVSLGYQYSYVFYYAILLLVGNESAPVTMTQTIFSSLVVIMGSIITAFIFGNMAALMAAMNQKDQQFQDQYDKIMSLMRSIMLPEEVQEEVDSYLMHIQQVPDLQQDMETFLELLSPTLRSQILFHMYKTIIRKIEIFDNCSDIELHYIVINMKTVIFLPNDEIIRQGDNGDNLYFISRGSADVFIESDEIKEDGQDKNLKSTNTLVDEKIDGKKDEKQQRKNLEKRKSLKVLKEGEYFGEIALMTSLQRTATIKAKEFCTLGFMTKKVFQSTKADYPQIWSSFKKEIMRRYKDENFEYRKNMIMNVPYFKNLNEEVVQELVYIMKSEKHDPNSLLIKRGDSTNRIFLLKFGTIDIEVPLKNGKLHFDVLNSGSCICIYSAFHEERKQKFDFRCKTSCSIETIKAEDIISLEKEQLELSDELRALRAKIENNEKTGFDFYRYVPPNMIGVNLTEEKKQLVRKKMRIAITNFGRQFKNKAKEQGKEVEELVKTDFKALYALNELEKERKKKEDRIEFLKSKSSGAYQLKSIAKLEKKGKTLRKTGDDDPFLEEEDNIVSLNRAKTDFKNFNMSRSFINQTVGEYQEGAKKNNEEEDEEQDEDSINKSLKKTEKNEKKKQTQFIIEEEQRFFHNDDRLRHEQIHDAEMLKKTGYAEVQMKFGRYEGSQKASIHNNASEVESLQAKKIDQPSSVTIREMKIKDEALKKVQQDQLETEQQESKVQLAYHSQNSLRGELNSKLPIKEGDVALPIMGGGPGMQDTISIDESPRHIPSRILDNLTLEDHSITKTQIKESGESRISDYVPLIAQRKKSYQYNNPQNNSPIQKPILQEIIDKDAEDFIREQQMKQHYQQYGELSDITKCPFMTRHYAELQGANDPEFFLKNQQIIQELQTQKFMEGAKFIPHSEKRVLTQQRESKEGLSEQVEFFEDDLEENQPVRLGKQQKGDQEIYQNENIENKVKIGQSSFVKQNTIPEKQPQKPLLLKDLPQKDSKADVQTKPSTAGSALGAGGAFGALGTLKRTEPEEEKKPTIAIGGLFGATQKAEEKPTGGFGGLLGVPQKTEEKPAGGLGGLFGGAAQKRSSNAGLGGLFGGKGDSGGGGFGSKLISGLSKNLVGSEADIKIVQMLVIINKSIQTQQESVATLARSMNKRFKTLDAKLNAIQIQKNMDNENGNCQNCMVSSRRTSELKSESLLEEQQNAYGKMDKSALSHPLREKPAVVDDRDEVETSKNFKGPVLNKNKSSYASSVYEDENVPTDNDGSRPFFSVTLRQQQYLTQNDTREAQNFGAPVEPYDQKDTIFTNNRPALEREAFEQSLRHLDREESMGNYQDSAPSFPPNEGNELYMKETGQPKIKNPGTSATHPRANIHQSANNQRMKAQKMHGKYHNINIQNQYNNIIHVNDEKMLAQLLQKEPPNDAHKASKAARQQTVLNQNILQQKKMFEQQMGMKSGVATDKSHNFELTSEEEIHESAMVDRQF